MDALRWHENANLGSAGDQTNFITTFTRLDLERKRDYAYGKVSSLFDCIKPQGAFYLFPDVSRHLGNGMTAADLARRLLEEAGVAVVPGEEFGRPGHIRISYAVSEDKLVSGLEKIAGAL